MFRLPYLYPINQPKVGNYRLKNISHFIDATLQFPVNDLPRINGSRIFIARLVEDFIGKIKSAPFRSIYTGHLNNNVQTDRIEKETIDFVVRYFSNGFEKEFEEFETIVAKDFESQTFKEKFEKQKGQSELNLSPVKRFSTGKVI